MVTKERYFILQVEVSEGKRAIGKNLSLFFFYFPCGFASPSHSGPVGGGISPLSWLPAANQIKRRRSRRSRRSRARRACAWISFGGDHQHGGSRRVHEVPLAAGVALCQQGNGLQLQRQEEIQHMEEAVDLPGQGREGLTRWVGAPNTRTRFSESPRFSSLCDLRGARSSCQLNIGSGIGTAATNTHFCAGARQIHIAPVVKRAPVGHCCRHKCA